MRLILSLKLDISKMSESQLGELERGYDAYVKGSNLRVLTTTVNSANRENIELVQEKAKAGYATGYADPEFIGELPVFNLPFLSDKKKYRTFQLKGDSMLPIPDGSWVTGEFLQDWMQIISGKAYIVFTLDDGIVFKVVENNLTKDGKLVLYSLNPVMNLMRYMLMKLRRYGNSSIISAANFPIPFFLKNNLYSRWQQ